MTKDFRNVYDDDMRAGSYDTLEFPGTYYLAFRDLPVMIGRHVAGGSALDFGCGTGRSTRFLRSLGFRAIGVDIAEPMLVRARERDPGGDYRLVADGDLTTVEDDSFDLVLSAFTFDNIPGMDRKVSLFSGLRRVLAPGGVIVNLVSSPEIYVHEWASFSTRDYPGNRAAKSGETVRIVMLDVEDRRPVEDILWSDEAYAEVYRRAGLEAIEAHRPLGNVDDPYGWVSETIVAPWVVYLLRRCADEAPDGHPNGRRSP